MANKPDHTKNVYLNDQIEVIRPDPFLPPEAKDELNFADFDDSDPNSLINMVPDVLKRAIQEVPVMYYEMAEDELSLHCFGEDEKNRPKQPDSTSERLRIAFWDEYDRASRYRERMEIRRICQGTCSEVYFVRKFIQDVQKLAYILHPPISYQINLKDLHELSLRGMRQILSMPIKDDKDRPNTRLMDIQFKIHQHVDMRLKGAIIQRIDQRNLNLNMNADVPQTTVEEISKVTQLSMSEIDKRIASLQAESKTLLTPAQVKVDLLKDAGVTELEELKETDSHRGKLPG